MNMQKLSITKPIVSIAEICQMIGLSRSRYYQLVDSGFFPKPKHDQRSNRPYFDTKLQKQILEARNSCIGVDGSYMLFYSPRKKESYSKKSKSSTKKSSIHQEFAETLNSMGLDCSEKDVSAALSELYPDGTNGIDQGLVIRELYRFLKVK
jgi:hypothetical protein